jgi:hypothetical protein
MPRYDYKCTNQECGALTEKIFPANEEKPKTAPCQACDSPAEFQFPAPAVMTSGMTNSPIDVAVGREANARWERIHEQQDKRNKVRTDTGSVGLAAAGVESFKPLSQDQKQARTAAFESVKRDGFKQDKTDAEQRSVM